jgi:hypothetical protein
MLKLKLRSMIASALNLLETLVALLAQHNENLLCDQQQGQLVGLQGENYELAKCVDQLVLVQKYYNVFAHAECMHFFTNLFFSPNSSNGGEGQQKAVKLNLVLAIIAHLDFESYNELPTEALFSNSKNNIHSLLQGEDDSSMMEELAERYAAFISQMDFSTWQNLTARQKLPNNQLNSSVSCATLRVLTRLLLFWQDLPFYKKPQLLDFLTQLTPDDGKGGSASSFLALLARGGASNSLGSSNLMLL